VTTQTQNIQRDPQDDCDDTIAERANISTEQDTFVTTQMQLLQIIEQKKNKNTLYVWDNTNAKHANMKTERTIRLRQHKWKLSKELNRTQGKFVTTQM